LTFDLYLVLDSGSRVSISYRDPSRQPVHHSVDISLEVQYESRIHCGLDIYEYRGSRSHNVDTHERSNKAGHFAQDSRYSSYCEPDTLPGDHAI